VGAERTAIGIPVPLSCSEQATTGAAGCGLVAGNPSQADLR
jgi:hypothetical protein